MRNKENLTRVFYMLVTSKWQLWRLLIYKLRPEEWQLEEDICSRQRAEIQSMVIIHIR